MQNFIETATLVLSDNDISTDDPLPQPITYAPNGFTNDTRTDRTWYNIDMQEVVGPELYANYKTFNIRLNAIVYLSCPDLVVVPSTELTYNIFMENLPFCQNTYNTALKYSTSQACIGSFVITPSDFSTAQYFGDTFSVAFYKCEKRNIRLFFQKLDGTPMDLQGNSLPRFTFYFSVFPTN